MDRSSSRQLAVLATTIAFIADPKTGSPTVPLVLVVTSLAALVLAFLPASNAHMGPAGPQMLRCPAVPMRGTGASRPTAAAARTSRV